jgi:hypothetical protein
MNCSTIQAVVACSLLFLFSLQLEKRSGGEAVCLKTSKGLLLQVPALLP